MYSTREISPDAMRKLAGNKGKHTEGQCTETLGSTWERDWVVGSQILTVMPVHRAPIPSKSKQCFGTIFL